MIFAQDGKKPIIGIVLDSQRRGSFSHRPHYALRKGYFDMVTRMGGLPVGIPTINEMSSAYIDHCDGFIVAGGDVAFPAEWYIDGRVSGYSENPERLAFEVGFLEAILEKDLPVLAICHGMQILAHVLGGKLAADISSYKSVDSHRTAVDKPITMHGLHIVSDSSLEGIATGASGAIEVNSHHKEGVVEIAEQYLTALASDGVIEAICSPEHRFVHGVQWHPELMTDAFTDAILTAFIKASAQ